MTVALSSLYLINLEPRRPVHRQLLNKSWNKLFLSELLRANQAALF